MNGLCQKFKFNVQLTNERDFLWGFWIFGTIATFDSKYNPEL